MQSAVCSSTSYARFWKDPGPFPQLIHITIAQITLEEPVLSAALLSKKSVLDLELNEPETGEMPIPNSFSKTHL